MAKTTRKNSKNSTSTQLAQGEIACKSPLILSRREGSDHGKTLLFGEEDLSELCFDIIADIDANDDNYDPDVKHLLAYPNNTKTEQ
eukprot:15051887-Ditylum_brightwellii.AAC.1